MSTMTEARPGDVRQVYLSRTRELLPRIAELAAQAEETRRIPQETLDAFAAMDFFRVMVPKRYGGFELDISAVTDIGRLVGRHCASSGWVLTWLGWHSHAVAQYPPTVQDHVFRDGYALVAGSPAPAAQVVPAKGGYTVSGRWSWATAVHHSDWLVLGGMVTGENRYVGLLVPVRDLIVHDNWHTEGMRATGSDDVEARDLFVPEEYVLDRALIGQNRSPGLSWNDGPLYRAPRGSLASLVAGAAGVGLGEWAVDDFRERLTTRRLPYSNVTQGEFQAEQIRLADIAVAMRSASLLYDEAVDVVARTCRGEHKMTVMERAEVRMWVAHAVALARETVRRVADASGSRMHFLNEPLQRALRDIQTLSSHVVFNPDRNGEIYGKVALGLEYDPATV